MNDGPAQPTIVWDHRTADACLFNAAALRVLPLLETRVLPVARPGERVVLTRGMPVPPELKLLNCLGFGCSEEDLLFVDATFPIDHPLPLGAGTVIHPFTSVSALSHDLNRRVADSSFRGCSHDIAVHVNRKATLQAWTRDHRIRVPDGRFVQTREETLAAIKEQLGRGSHAMFKPDFSASGIGQVHFDRRSDLSDEALDRLMLPGVVQRRVAKTCDVSLQFEIGMNWGGAIGNGLPLQPHLRELTGQFVSADGDYLGGFYPTSLSEALEGAIREMGQAVVVQLMMAGYRGPGSIDFLVNEHTHEIWVNDVNARIVAPWYPLEMIRRRHQSHRPLPFIMRSFRIPVGMSISVLTELFQGHFFSWESCEGFVPFAFLPQAGFCYGAVFAKDSERCRELDHVVEETKQPLCL